MKKKNVVIIVLCVVVVALIAVVAFLIGKNNSKTELPTYNPTVTKPVATNSDTDVAEQNGENVNPTDIKVVKKYVFLDEEDFNMVLVVENTGKGDAAVAVVGKVYDGANKVIGTERESIFLDPGAKSVVSFDFDTEGVKVKNDDYKLSVAKATTIKPGIKNIESKNSVNGRFVNLTSKNTGNFDLEGVDAYCLFYDNGELIDVDSEDVHNQATEIFEKGTTTKQKFDTDEKYDKVKVYYTQSQDTPDADEEDDD
ncbi:MAG: hypothetical protein K6E58_04830 [Eubacterium sp.]|nr:hypothetical protein [Eubacterium sp.]